MAIDTRQKRFSIMGMRMHALVGITLPLFEADGTVDLDDRQHLLGLYSGIAFGAAVALGASPAETVVAVARSWDVVGSKLDAVGTPRQFKVIPYGSEFQ